MKQLSLSSEEMDFIAGYISGCLGERFIQGDQKVDFTCDVAKVAMPSHGCGAPSGAACEITLKFIAPWPKKKDYMGDGHLRDDEKPS